MRLTSDERSYLRLVESVISVTDYTGRVDADFPSSNKRQNLMLKQVLSLPACVCVLYVSGIVYKLVVKHEFAAHICVLCLHLTMYS